MSQWLRQGTSAVVTFGPFLAKGNGVSILSGAGIITSIDHTTTGILLSKNGGAAAIRHQPVSPSTYDAHGFFKVTLDATDTDTPGTLLLMHSEPATYLSVWRVFMVIPAQVWDSLFGTDRLQVDVQEQANIDFGALQKASLNAATPAVTVSDKTGFSLSVTPPTKEEISTKVWGETVRSLTDKTGFSGTVTDKTGFSLSVDGILAIWHQALSAIATSSTIGKLIKDYLDAAISTRSTYAGGAVASVTAAVTVGTNNDKSGYSLQTAPPTASDIKTAIEASTVLAKVADLPGEAPTVEAIREEMDDHSSKLAGIASEANSSRVILDAIADTGSYPVGSKLWTYTVRRSDTHAVVPGATVEAYSDEACSPANLAQSAISNASGVATFRLIPGVYYILVIAPGYNVPDADREVVT